MPRIDLGFIVPVRLYLFKQDGHYLINQNYNAIHPLLNTQYWLITGLSTFPIQMPGLQQMLRSQLASNHDEIPTICSNN